MTSILCLQNLCYHIFSSTLPTLPCLQALSSIRAHFFFSPISWNPSTVSPWLATTPSYSPPVTHSAVGNALHPPPLLLHITYIFFLLSLSCSTCLFPLLALQFTLLTLLGPAVDSSFLFPHTLLCNHTPLISPSFAALSLS